MPAAKTAKAPVRDSAKGGAWPDAQGRFGAYGGRYVPETLIPALDQLTAAFAAARTDKSFAAEYSRLLRDFVGRPTPLTKAGTLSSRFQRRIYLKREDLCHTGAHKINNALGQALLAKRLGKKRVIAETGAGQHGVATATACALLGLKCRVYMGVEDMRRQLPNVFRMKLLGTDVVGVQSGTKTLKDAVNDALRDWVTNVEDTHDIIGSALGPHPYPLMVREFQRVIGEEAREQILKAEGRLPHALVACVGGGSNAIGLFHPFLADEGVRLIGVEAAGHGVSTDKHAASLTGGRPGVLHGNRTYLLQDDDGQIIDAHSISAGLDYPGIGPEHSFLHEIGRAEYVSTTDTEALEAFKLCSTLEGIIPALEPAHALARVGEIAQELGKGKIVVMNLCGRGDKDIFTVAEALGRKI